LHLAQLAGSALGERLQLVLDLLGLVAFQLNCLEVLIDGVAVELDEAGVLALLFSDVTLAEVALELDDCLHAGLDRKVSTLFLFISS
jgi:hypothetical protein